MEESYKPNSNRYKETQEKEGTEVKTSLEKIVSGPVKVRKKSKFSIFASEFISDDAKKIKSYVFGDVLIPAVKKAISDIVVEGINILLYGESRGKSRNSADRVSYRSYYDRDTRASSVANRGNTPYNGYSYDDIVLSTRGEANDVLSRLDEIIDTYGIARVADLYDLVGITGNFTDNKYGWSSVKSADIIRVSDGYMIKMPRAIVID